MTTETSKPDLSRARAEDLLQYIDASPSPWHAVRETEQRLQAAGFTELSEKEAWKLKTGGQYYVTRNGTGLIAFQLSGVADKAASFRIVGSHTDSPGMRVKPHGEQISGGMIKLGVETYGGPILATWADRELTLAGRVVLRDTDGFVSRLVNLQRPLLRIPTLAVHMDRDVNSKGLKLEKQSHLPLLLEAAGNSLPEAGRLLTMLAAELECDTTDISAFELLACDTQPGSFYGPGDEFYAVGRIDNLAACHASIEALLDAGRSGTGAACRVAALFDNEEIGSQSAQGAQGAFLMQILERITLAQGGGREDLLRALAAGFLISADAAHALHPNHIGKYDPQHHVHLNQGPVIKINQNLRYTSDGLSASAFRRWCEQADVPCQTYVHHSDLPCGSTIGPMTAARLGMPAVDVGNPILSMHSIRECGGAADQDMMIRALSAFYGES